MTAEAIAAHQWLVRHSEELDKYSGKWVAVGENRLLGVAKMLKVLMQKPEVKKVKSPLFTMIPRPDESPSIL